MENGNSETRWNEEVRLVLIGNTGAGKSASGNTILGRSLFLSKMSGGSVTKICQYGTTELTEKQDAQKDGQGDRERRKRKIMVVDVPGFGDTSLSGAQILNEVTKCVALAAPGPHAFLLVVPLGRYTDSENQALCQLAEIFGENAVRHHTVVLFTRGDELEGLEIETYLRESGNLLLNSLIEMCGGRYHVFNNKETGNSLQVEELLTKVDNMVKHTAEGFYTNAMFSEAEAIIREEEERMMKQREADWQSARESEENFRGKGRTKKRSGSTSSRNQSRGTHAGGSREQSNSRIKAVLSPNVQGRIKIVVAALATGLAVGATFGALVPLAAVAGASLTGATLTGATGSAVAFGALVGGCSGGCVGFVAATEAASAGEAAFNTLQQVSVIGTVAVGLGGVVGLALGAMAVPCAGGAANVASSAAPTVAGAANVATPAAPIVAGAANVAAPAAPIVAGAANVATPAAPMVAGVAGAQNTIAPAVGKGVAAIAGIVTGAVTGVKVVSCLKVKVMKEKRHGRRKEQLLREDLL